MGATLDGIPESFILGISVASGGGISIPFLVAVIVSNLPEGMASAAELGGDSGFTNRRILGMWAIVVGVSALAAALGAVVMGFGTATGAAAEAFAAGALLTMLTDDLIPVARERGGIGAGLAAVFGFAVAFALHELGA
jgi:ZIP family zinc transporter